MEGKSLKFESLSLLLSSTSYSQIQEKPTLFFARGMIKIKGNPPLFSRTAPRRSPRFLSTKISCDENPNAHTKQASSSPISSPSETLFRPPKEGAYTLRSRRLGACPMKEESSAYESGKHARKVDAAQASQILRRSPRFHTPNSINIHEEKWAVEIKKTYPGETVEKRGSSEVTQKGNFWKGGRNHKITEFWVSSKVTRRASAEKDHRILCKSVDSAKFLERAKFGVCESMEFVKDVKNVEEGFFVYDEYEQNKENRTSVIGSMVSVSMKLSKDQAKKRRKTEVGNGGIDLFKGKTWKCEKVCAHQGWTDDQEASLRRAYFSTKPTPNFWKKVSKMVFGKSAQECFDRIHADLPTPQQLQPRSRTKGTNLSPLSNFSLSCGELLQPINENIKRPKSTKRKSHCAQKTARHLLTKHQVADQGYEADLFPILEGQTDSFNQAVVPSELPLTTNSVPEISGSHKKNQESSNEKCLISPLVLKQVKNMALHEKYIDQLHNRETRRKRMASHQRRGFVCSEDGTEEKRTAKKDIRAAKNALVSDATDFIKAFKQKQEVSIWEDEDFDADDEDEGEDEL